MKTEHLNLFLTAILLLLVFGYFSLSYQKHQQRIRLSGILPLSQEMLYKLEEQKND